MFLAICLIVAIAFVAICIVLIKKYGFSQAWGILVGFAAAVAAAAAVLWDKLVGTVPPQ